MDIDKLDSVVREIEAEWVRMCAMLPKDVPPSQITEMHRVYFAGVRYIVSILSTLDPNSPTDRKRMDNIRKELVEFRKRAVN